MKKFLIAAIIIFLFTGTYNSFAQGKFSATVTNTNNVVTFSLKPDVTTTTGFSDIEFFLVSPASSPAFTWGAVTANTTNFPGMTATSVLNSGSWEIDRNDFPIAGYNVDHFIYTGPAPATTAASYTGGTEYQLISVPLLGSPALVNFTLLDVEPREYVYYSVTDQNGGDLRPASASNYFYPTTLTTTASTYPGVGDNTNTVYYLSLLNVPVPVKFTGFSATKKDDNALLNWAVVNENTTGNSYQVERSINNGTSFTTIASIPVKSNSISNSYAYTDDNLSSLGVTTIYYRIEQVDQSGNPTYTEVRAVSLASGVTVSAYPNPAKDNVSVTINLPEASSLSISVTDALGKQLQLIQSTGVKGTNLNSIDLSGYAPGNYLIKVTSGSGTTTLPIVKE